MNANLFYRLLSVLLVIVLVLGGLCILSGGTLLIVRIVQSRPDTPAGEPSLPTGTSERPTMADPTAVMLAEGADAGLSYQDSLIFFGESTTTHLRARGVLTGGKDTLQVWSDASGTRMLSTQITSQPIVYPDTGESMRIAAACEAKKPAFVVLSFGLNGITGFIQNKQNYVNSYTKLIRAIQTASPDTRVILQTVYPVANAESFSVDVDTLNAYIMTLNEWLPEIAAANQNVRVADTASVLRNADGRLAKSYDSGDGIHLTEGAYRAVLSYLRTHAWVDTNQ